MHCFDNPTDLGSPTGATLNLYHLAPESPPRAVVQINHGLAEHALRYREFARLLVKNGFAVLAHDHRGHGHTRAPDAIQGVFSRAASGEAWLPVIDDILAIHDHADQRFPGVPVITFGHSMGGTLAINFALTHPDRSAALAVWNANFRYGLSGRLGQGLLRTERLMFGSDVPSRILPRLTFDAWDRSISRAGTGFDWLSHDPARVQAYIDDPLCGWSPSVSLWQDIFAMGYRAADPSALSALPATLPIQMVAGGQDPMTNGGRAVDWYAKRLRAAGLTAVTCRIYEDMRHETLMESAPPGAETAMLDFVKWARGSVDGLQVDNAPLGRA